MTLNDYHAKLNGDSGPIQTLVLWKNQIGLQLSFKLSVG